MAKASPLFKIAEFVYNLAIPAARGRKMISFVDPDNISDTQRADYNAYQGAVLCFVGGIALVPIFPRLETLLLAVALAAYGYSRAEKLYPPLAENLAPFFPAGQDIRPMAERWAEIAAQDEDSTASAAGQRPEKTSGTGPWVVYVIDADGVEKRLPRRFETDSAAQTYADLQRVLSRGNITHSGVTYAPEK